MGGQLGGWVDPLASHAWVFKKWGCVWAQGTPPPRSPSESVTGTEIETGIATETVTEVTVTGIGTMPVPFN